MSDRDRPERNPFQDWLESSQAFLADGAMDPGLREKSRELFEAWGRFGQAIAGAGGGAAASGGPFDPAGWVDMAGGGGFGDLWSWFGGGDGGPVRAFKASAEWAAYGAALNRYRAVLGAAWLAAFKRFAAEAAEAAATSDFQSLQAAWQRAADHELAAAQRSDTYLAAQRDLIAARLACTKLLRGQIDEIAALLGLPTRAETDALHRALHDLSREVRALRERKR